MVAPTGVTVGSGSVVSTGSGRVDRIDGDRINVSTVVGSVVVGRIEGVDRVHGGGPQLSGHVQIERASTGVERRVIRRQQGVLRIARSGRCGQERSAARSSTSVPSPPPGTVWTPPVRASRMK